MLLIFTNLINSKSYLIFIYFPLITGKIESFKPSDVQKVVAVVGSQILWRIWTKFWILSLKESIFEHRIGPLEYPRLVDPVDTDDRIPLFSIRNIKTWEHFQAQHRLELMDMRAAIGIWPGVSFLPQGAQRLGTAKHPLLLLPPCLTLCFLSLKAILFLFRNAQPSFFFPCLNTSVQNLLGKAKEGNVHREGTPG